MKKLLVGTAVVALGFGLAAPAQAAADGVKLGLGGHFKGYVSWLDQDEDTNADADAAIEDVRAFDILRETEIHFTGESTLDNGLTVGFHLEAETDGFAGGAGDTFDIEESYAYFSGAWGRVNFGSEDGAAFLLQVSAPSADENIDGVRQHVQPINFARTDLGADATVGTGILNYRFDYDNAVARSDNKLTYMTPVFNGFQFGASYTPDLGTGAASLAGNVSNDTINDFGAVWEAAGRYEGQLGDVGVALGGGYSHADLEDEVAGGARDDRAVWDAGLDLNWGAFGLGGAYLHDDNGFDLDSDETTWTVGIDYTTGPFKLGASYYDMTRELDGTEGAANSGDFESDRWMAGVVYTYGPGMTFRGSVGFVDVEVPATSIGAGLNTSTDATYVMMGTQINF